MGRVDPSGFPVSGEPKIRLVTGHVRLVNVSLCLVQNVLVLVSFAMFPITFAAAAP